MRIRRIVGIEFDRHAEVADVIVEEVLAGRVRRSVARDANRIAELAEYAVGDVQRFVGRARPAAGPRQSASESWSPASPKAEFPRSQASASAIGLQLNSICSGALANSPSHNCSA